MSPRNGIAIGIFGFAALLLRAAAQEPALPPERVLILKGGRVVQGRTSATDDQYVIERSGGKILLPRDEVERECRTLEEAYRYTAARVNDADPDEHVKLAQWCLQVGLVDHAIAELERATKIVPGGRAERMLQSVRAVRDHTPRQVGHRRGAASQPRMLPTEFLTAGAEISPEAVKKFTLQVQPLLMRSCGAVGCHSRQHNGPFVMHRFIRANRKTTQRNLHAALASIDFADPGNSPLLTRAVSAHGNTRTPPLFGARNLPFETLRAWVLEVAAQPESDPLADPLVNTPPPLAARLPESPPGETAAKPAATADRDTPDIGITPSTTVKPVSMREPPANRGAVAGSTAQAPPARLPAELPPYEPVDPFDPEIFNRQFAQ